MAKIFSDFEREQRIAIGYGCTSRDNAEVFLQLFHVKDFPSPIHQTIYDAIEKAYENLHTISPLAVIEFLDEDLADNYKLEKYQQDYEDSKDSIEIIARTLRDNRLRKHIKAIGMKLDEQSYNSDVSSYELIKRMRSALELLENKAGLVAFNHTTPREVVEQHNEYIELLRQGKQIGIPTGINHLKERLRWSGYALGELTVVGSVRSVGKTANLLQSFTECGHADIPACYINLESSNRLLYDRMSLRWTNGEVLSEDALKKDEYVKNALAFENWFKSKRLFFENKIKEVNNLRVYIKSMVNQYGIKAVFIDYGNKLKNDKVEREQRYRGLTITYEILQEIAVDFNIAVVVAHQLAQKAEKADYEPTLSDFKESGGVSDVADTAIMFWGDIQALDIFCKIGKQKNWKPCQKFLVRFDRQKQMLQNGLHTESFKSAF